MNIKGSKNNKKKLFESGVEITPTQMAQINTSIDLPNSEVESIKKVFENESNLFKFDNGNTMAKIDSPVSIRFGLKYHAQNTSTFDEFCASVKTLVGDLTDSDIKKLSREYNKLYPNK